MYWREYPGVAGIDPKQVLQGPTPEEGLAAGRDMIAEVRAALTAEFGLAWALPPEGQDDLDLFIRRVQNSFGGESLLTAVNALPAQSTSVPRDWADKQRALEIVGTVIARYGYSVPAVDTFDLWTDEQRMKDLGGLTPETQVIVSGMAAGPAGQWLSFAFQDLSKDTAGQFDERLALPPGSDRQQGTFSLSYGANGLPHDADRKEFTERLKPFAGLTPPVPLET